MPPCVGEPSVRWGTSPEALQKRADVAAGILSAVSVGYRIDQTEFEPETNTLTATRWTPLEVSLVSLALPIHPLALAAPLNIPNRNQSPCNAPLPPP